MQTSCGLETNSEGESAGWHQRLSAFPFHLQRCWLPVPRCWLSWCPAWAGPDCGEMYPLCQGTKWNCARGCPLCGGTKSVKISVTFTSHKVPWKNKKKYKIIILSKHAWKKNIIILLKNLWTTLRLYGTWKIKAWNKDVQQSSTMNKNI